MHRPALAVLGPVATSDPSLCLWVGVGAIVLNRPPEVPWLDPDRRLVADRWTVLYGEPKAIELPLEAPRRHLSLVNEANRYHPRHYPFASLVQVPDPGVLSLDAGYVHLAALRDAFAAGVDVELTHGSEVTIRGDLFRLLQEPGGSPHLSYVAPASDPSITERQQS